MLTLVMYDKICICKVTIVTILIIAFGKEKKNLETLHV